MITKLPIEINGEQFRLCVNDEVNSPCENCVFENVLDCPSDICNTVLGGEAYFERV